VLIWGTRNLAHRSWKVVCQQDDDGGESPTWDEER